MRLECRKRIEFVKWSVSGDNDQQAQNVFSVSYIIYNYSPLNRHFDLFEVFTKVIEIK